MGYALRVIPRARIDSPRSSTNQTQTYTYPQPTISTSASTPGSISDRRGGSDLNRCRQLMTIDWNSFTPWTALAGGVLIGIAAAMFVLLNGRIAGISGVLGGLHKPHKGDVARRVAFVGGLIAAPLLYAVSFGHPEAHIDAGYGALVAAGLLVGAGTRYGSGCTSGHGVCGLSRLSPRSLVATGTFMFAGLVFGIGLLVSGMANPNKVLGFLDLAGPWDPSLALVMAGAIAVGVVAFAVARQRTISFLGAEMKLPAARQIDPQLVSGSVLFGVGWGIAGLCPGPALVSLGTGQVKAVVIVLAMVAGMGVFELLERSKLLRTATAH